MVESTSNITQTILSTINYLFSSLYSSVDNSVYAILDDIVFISPNILQDNFMSQLLGTSATSRNHTNSKLIITWIFVILYSQICLFSLYQFIYRATISIFI